MVSRREYACVGAEVPTILPAPGTKEHDVQRIAPPGREVGSGRASRDPGVLVGSGSFFVKKSDPSVMVGSGWYL